MGRQTGETYSYHKLYRHIKPALLHWCYITVKGMTKSDIKMDTHEPKDHVGQSGCLWFPANRLSRQGNMSFTAGRCTFWDRGSKTDFRLSVPRKKLLLIPCPTVLLYPKNTYSIFVTLFISPRGLLALDQKWKERSRSNPVYFYPSEEAS